jgi:hypothetical protein
MHNNRKEKILIILFISQISLMPALLGQRYPDDLGRLVFKAFKEDSLDLVYRLKPTTAEFEYLIDSIGLDRKTLPNTDFDANYNVSLVDFKKQCELIYRKAKFNNLIWRKMVLQRVAFYEKRGLIKTPNLNGKEIITRNVTIYFYCFDMQYMIVLNNVWAYKDRLKIGGQIDFEVLNKRSKSELRW